MRAVRTIAIAVLIVALVGVGIFFAFTTIPWGNVKLAGLTADDFAVTRDAIPAEAFCPADKTASMDNVKGPFLYDDAVSTKLASKDDKSEDVFASLRSDVICKEVGTGFAANEMLSSDRLAIDGKTIASVNPWQAEMAAKFKEDGATAFLTMNWFTHHYEVTDEYRTYAALINTVLLRFQKVYISADKSVANWHIGGSDRFAVSAKALVFPLAVLNKKYEEDKPALWLKAVDKSGECHFIVGFNLGDKRPEIGKCESTPPSNPPTNPPSGPPSGPPSHPPTNPPHKCKPNQTGTWPKCLDKKDGSKDPSQNGNAGNGGGKNQDPGPGPTTTPKPVPTASYTPPPPPKAPDPEPTRSAPPKEQPTEPPKTGDPGGF